jgi:trimeric autotransporter adhesin
LKLQIPAMRLVRKGATFLKQQTLVVFLAFFLISLQSYSQVATVTSGKSFINISRPNGGTFLPGDTLEIRATIAITGGSNTAANRINSIRYNDTINLAKLTYLTGSLQMISNEGHIQQTYSDLADTDSANIDLPSGRLRFNIGGTSGACDVNTQGNGVTNAGFLWGAVKPTFYFSTCIRVYVYRVQIKKTASIVDIDTAVILNAGNFRYRLGSSLTDVLSNFSAYTIRIAPDYGVCANAIGTNALVSESGGTFDLGHNKNRPTNSPIVPLPYTRKMFTSGTPNDNFYGIANNTSGTWSTNPNLPQPDPARVFNIWDIMGDHTGALNPAAGNPPADTTIAGSKAGYALIINASYETNKAFDQTINNLCEETYYEFAAWFKNICRRCSCDSSGKGAMTTNYVYGPGKDSSGVRPNLSFQINGEEYYTSGNIAYNGMWVKKGFVFKTKTGQHTIQVTIRNNAPGGGGNDWAVDDIDIATCLPNMRYSPSITPTICMGNAMTITDTVRSFFNNYVYYKWQRSTDGGTTWVDVTGALGPASPTLIAGSWQYVSGYTIPPAFTTLANSGNKYRLVVATSVTNLSDINCRSTDPNTIVTLNIINCGPPLSTKFTTLSGKIANSKAQLNWTTGIEEDAVEYDVEKSFNGSSFAVIGTISGHNDQGATVNNYSFTDPQDIVGKVYYRIAIRTPDNRIGYSRTLLLLTSIESFSFANVVNPFANELYLDISSAKDGTANAELVNQYGVAAKAKILDIKAGMNQLVFDNTGSLPAGIYVLKVTMGEDIIYRKVVKQNH